MINNLGINTVYVEVEDLESLGLKRMEMCLGRMGSYEDRLKKMSQDIALAKEKNIPFSIHLPMFLDKGFTGDYLDVFFLDPNPEKREASYELLEYNLKEMQKIQPDYCVLHFAGVYRQVEGPFDDFNEVLKGALDRINGLAAQYQTKILLEYMGSNIRFKDYTSWINALKGYSHVGLITDTGHLYFASLIHGFDYMEALETLAPASDAFHLWTTKGDKAYFESDYYKKYHHIVPHIKQFKKDHWAFDTKAVFARLLKENKPIIIEASIVYRGEKYFFEGITSLVDLLASF